MSIYKYYNKIQLSLNNFKIIMGIGDWGLGIGDWGLGIGPNPQSPIPKYFTLFDKKIFSLK